jgi:drug/metabolite transporter (DMT)-like permease
VLESQIIGIAATLASCTVFALNYVLIESIISAPTAPPSQVIQGYAGAYSLGLISIYVVLHTLPNWHVLVTENVTKSNGNWTFIAFVYFGKTCAAFFHSYSYYKLVSLVGAVSTGVLQSLRAVSVFLISAVLFCGLHHEQCYNMMKAISTLVVVSGLYYFSHLKMKELKKNTAKLELPIQNSNGNVQM